MPLIWELGGANRRICVSPDVLKKAAPRFELGVKALQAPALPLGYAAASSIYYCTKFCRLCCPLFGIDGKFYAIATVCRSANQHLKPSPLTQIG
jgi:hypothetical protein